MKTMTVGDIKTHFSQVLKDVQKGEKIGITYGRTKEVRAIIGPNEEPKQPRKLGILADKGKVVFKDDFKMTEEEFLGL